MWFSLHLFTVIPNNSVVPSYFPLFYKKLRAKLEDKCDAPRSKSRVLKTELSLLSESFKNCIL